MNDRFMVDAEVVARVLNISKPAVYQLADRKQLPFESHKFGKCVRFKRSEVEAFIGQPLDEMEATNA